MGIDPSFSQDVGQAAVGRASIDQEGEELEERLTGILRVQQAAGLVDEVRGASPDDRLDECALGRTSGRFPAVLQRARALGRRAATRDAGRDPGDAFADGWLVRSIVPERLCPDDQWVKRKVAIVSS